MPVVTTYPGVYIQEIPSGVQTITGVATSIAAFIGYTEQGPVDKAIHIFSFADFQRSFGGITVDSPLSYAVNQFFQNGGTEAYVVRVAKGAASASIILSAGDSAHTPVIQVAAVSDGTWGNLVQLDLDYNTINPDSLFNLTVTQFVNQNGQLAPALIETYRNLSMSSMNPNYFLPAINGASQIVNVTLENFVFNNAGYSQSGPLPDPVTGLDLTHNSVAVSVDGGAPLEFALFSTPPSSPSLGDVKNLLQTALNQAFGSSAPQITTAGKALKVTSSKTDQTSSVRFLQASVNDASSVLQLGVGNGGFEVEGAAHYRPVLNGTLGSSLSSTFPTLKPSATINFDVYQAGATSPINGSTSIGLPLWGTTVPANANDVKTAIALALSNAVNPSPAYKFLAGTTVEVDTLLGTQQFRLVPPSNLPGCVYFKITDSGDGTAPDLGLTAPQSTNFANYQLGVGDSTNTVKTVTKPVSGDNGSLAQTVADYGNQAAKTGMYSLENIDLFNIMCLPDLDGSNAALNSLYMNAALYCQQRRAMLIVDLPPVVLPAKPVAITNATNWLSGTGASIGALPAKNVAAYFPRILVADPLQNGTIRQLPACGAIAGIWAQTDGQRGVWKAPAGTATQIAGAAGLAYRMNDQENGILNPLGLNCLRTFPMIGSVVWGARTRRGADALSDDDNKYIPVRRLTLFLEESLFRGTQWVVFEPNDEPLWARIRLTVGSFMQSLYRQGAFAGQTPQSAYYVKCDSETTTPYDQDQGRVNILVGFAPLRPAEFVVIQIQQILSVGPT